jgi:hypothetical protein
MTALVEQGCQADRQLCVYEEPSRGSGPVHPPAACGQRTEFKCRKQVVALQVRVICEDLIERHARGQQF